MGLDFSTPRLCREPYQEILPPQCLSDTFLPHQISRPSSAISPVYSHNATAMVFLGCKYDMSFSCLSILEEPCDLDDNIQIPRLGMYGPSPLSHSLSSNPALIDPPHLPGAPTAMNFLLFPRHIKLLHATVFIYVFLPLYFTLLPLKMYPGVMSFVSLALTHVCFFSITLLTGTMSYVVQTGYT